MNVNGKIDIKVPWIEGLSLTAMGAIDRGIYLTKKFDNQYKLYTWMVIQLMKMVHPYWKRVFMVDLLY
jgi:hypothetical protein